MKILYIIPDLSFTSGGPVAFVLNAAKAMIPLGHQVNIGATDHAFQREDFSHDLLRPILGRCDFKKWRWSGGMKNKLIPVIREADIVHLHGVWEYPIWLGGRICKELGKPYVLSSCGMLERWPLKQKRWQKSIYLKLIGKSVIDHAAAVHFTSEREKLESLSVIGAAIPNFVCALGVDGELSGNLPAPSAFRKRFAAVGEDRMVLCLGRVHYKKQPDLLIRAFKSVFEKYPNTCLVFAGPGEDRYLLFLKKLAADLRIGHKVFFTGMLTGDAKKEALAAADIFALPSLQENFGIAVAEAMAVGCPVVISDAVDLASDVRVANAGLVCSNSAESFTTAILKLLKDKSLRQQMGENGRRLAREAFAWPRIAQFLAAQYQEVIVGDRLSQQSSHG
jgi:glycosyltransferase involved in cell wall biosynthesis